MEPSEEEFEFKYDVPILLDRIKSGSLTKVIIQAPENLLTDTFRLKRFLQKVNPDLSIVILCDRHFFFNFLK